MAEIEGEDLEWVHVAGVSLRRRRLDEEIGEVHH